MGSVEREGKPTAPVDSVQRRCEPADEEVYID